MLLCLLKEMDFGILEWAVIGNVVLLLILLVVLFYTICRLRKATRKNQLEETLPYSDTSDLVPQRYSTLCGLKSGNTRQNGISILASEDLRRFEKSRMSNFHLEKSPTPMITMTPSSGPPAYISATLPLPAKKKLGMSSQMKVPMQWTPPPPYWIALPSTMAPPSTTFQYVGPYTTLPAVLKKQQKCRHEQLRNNGHHHVSSSSRRAIESASSSPHHCRVVHSCGKKVQLQEDCWIKKKHAQPTQGGCGGGHQLNENSNNLVLFFWACLLFFKIYIY